MSRIKHTFDSMLLRRMAEFPSNRPPIEKHSITRLTAVGRGNCGREYRIVMNRKTGTVLEDSVTEAAIHPTRQVIEVTYDNPLAYLSDVYRLRR